MATGAGAGGLEEGWFFVTVLRDSGRRPRPERMAMAVERITEIPCQGQQQEQYQRHFPGPGWSVVRDTREFSDHFRHGASTGRAIGSEEEATVALAHDRDDGRGPAPHVHRESIPDAAELRRCCHPPHVLETFRAWHW